jgi:hypothetical protein
MGDMENHKDTTLPGKASSLERKRERERRERENTIINK